MENQRIQIPWIGCNEAAFQYHLRGLNNKTGDYSIIPAADASTGISLLSETDYKGVIIHHFVHWLGSLEVPSRLTRDPLELTCYFLELVRKLPKYEKTPIMVTHIMGVDKLSKNKLTLAGAGKFVDLYRNPPLKFREEFERFFITPNPQNIKTRENH